MRTERRWQNGCHELMRKVHARDRIVSVRVRWSNIVTTVNSRMSCSASGAVSDGPVQFQISDAFSTGVSHLGHRQETHANG